VIYLSVRNKNFSVNVFVKEVRKLFHEK
jgi:hypothetical protein